MRCKARILSLQRSESQHKFYAKTWEFCKMRWLFLVLCFVRSTADDNLLRSQLFLRLAQTIGGGKNLSILLQDTCLIYRLLSLSSFLCPNFYLWATLHPRHCVPATSHCTPSLMLPVAALLCLTSWILPPIAFVLLTSCHSLNYAVLPCVIICSCRG